MRWSCVGEGGGVERVLHWQQTQKQHPYRGIRSHTEHLHARPRQDRAKTVKAQDTGAEGVWWWWWGGGGPMEGIAYTQQTMRLLPLRPPTKLSLLGTGHTLPERRVEPSGSPGADVRRLLNVLGLVVIPHSVRVLRNASGRVEPGYGTHLIHVGAVHGWSDAWCVRGGGEEHQGPAVGEQDAVVGEERGDKQARRGPVTSEA